MGKAKILLVDDEPMILQSLEFNLEEYADQILTALNGIEALEILAKETVDCVVCDINMSKMGGMELIKKLREKNNQVPFIFYSGHGHKELMLEALQYDATDFLNKPHIEQLELVVEHGLEQGFAKDAFENLEPISEYRKYKKEQQISK